MRRVRDAMSESPLDRFDEYAKTFRARVFAGAAMLSAGVAFVFFSGCFLIGALTLLRPNTFLDAAPPGLNADDRTLLYALYGMAAVCFFGGIVMAGRGFSALSRVVAERP
jgi:hypothetical protein